MEHRAHAVEVWEEQVVIPTYAVGKADRNPMFLEKRVYQGSSGKVYPLPVIDKICDEKKDMAYNAVWLENDYLRVMILPELGGRIQRAYDKTNHYDFVYYNEVIKPALVGLAGPWISGGIEFNWPQHHRPTTYSPVDYTLCENPDGSKTVRVNETDQMYGTKAVASFTLYPDRAYIEIRGQLYNPTALPQTFLWWANPAVAVNDHTQSIFPPDVHAVMDHGKRAVSKFPIATGEYYKHDYGAGVDISRYKNIPVPTSYMAYRSDYDFVGGYDYAVEAGILHIADHHVSPGKKQWTWGCGEFGQAWDRNLTDGNGPYIELMTGVFTDNQPDFTWLAPFEEKVFTQYFMPYKQVGCVKNASTEVVLGLETEAGEARICVYAAQTFARARITLTAGRNVLLEERCDLSPRSVYRGTAATAEQDPWRLTLTVYTADGRKLLSYTPAKPAITKVPDPAKAAKSPEEVPTNEQLYLTGLHIEQYRHATYLPDPYYLEGLKRDPGDSRINTAYGRLLLRRGLFAKSEGYFRSAIERLTAMSPNPYDGEAFYYLGLSLRCQGKEAEAFDAFYKATWTSTEQEMGFYYLAAIACAGGRFEEALEHVERALVRNSRSGKTRGLKAVLLRLTGRSEAARIFLDESLAIDPFDYVSRFEHCGFDDVETLRLMRAEPNAFLGAARQYAEAGRWEEAVRILRACGGESPLLHYYEAYYLEQQGLDPMPALRTAAAADPLYCFPNKLEDIAVLEFACARNGADARAPYYLGNLWYDKRHYEAAHKSWERSVELDPSYPTPWRNLALVYFNKENDPGRAQRALEKAFALDPADARVLLELDQLYKKRGLAPAERLKNFEANREAFEQRDDLWVEHITLLNLLGSHQEAYDRIMCHKFHPWEGGEGKITTQYTLSLRELGRAALEAGRAAEAERLLRQALSFPHNLGEGKLEGARDNDLYYYLGCACADQGRMDEARVCWGRASVGSGEPAGIMYYNDQPADMILYQGLAHRKLGREAEARSRFHRLVDYGEAHMFDEVKIDYFAVSLPDLQLFDEDLTLRNKAHCHYLIALGSYGLGDQERAARSCGETLSIDRAHIGATSHKPIFQVQ